MLQLQFGPQQLRDFQFIREAGPGLLGQVIEKIAKLSPLPLKPSRLLPIVKESVGGDADLAEALMRQCLALNGLMRQAGLDVHDTIKGVRAAIERDAEWTESDLEKWKNIETTLQSLLALRAFEIVATAIELSYEYANLYRKGRILTDIRPLFSKKADSIEGAVVSFTLRLRFDNVDGDHDLSIAMDASDVRELAQQCDRALAKSQTALELMKSLSISTIVTGEKDND